MNIPMSWLKQYVDLDCDLKEFIDKMTMSGSKVEGVEEIGKEIKGVVVGKIISIEKHPDADKLVVTKVDVGQEFPLQIITGATNVFEGAYVPIATDGSTLCRGVKIKRGKIRGVESCGMMCSIEELGFTKQDYPDAPEDGIYIFSEKYPLGKDVVPILELSEDVVEFEITSNRPDCFSVLGIAREAAATFSKHLKYPDIKVKEEGGGNAGELISVEIKNPNLCPRYTARIVKNIKIGPSPQWMCHRLSTAGIRPINNIVDITNYVMLELGQPMHAFDIDNIDEKKIIVRNAYDDEEFITLDGITRKLDSTMTVISDCNKAIAVGGIMGGENSKITENASGILFESANFNGPNIRVTAKKLGLRTDASSKFEKGIDPNIALEAVNRAAQLVEELKCGEVVKGVVDCYPQKRESHKVGYSTGKINKILGTNFTEEEVKKYLNKVCIANKDGMAIVPTYRPDIEIEADILEEIARLYGYDKIVPTLATGTPTVGKKTFKQTIEEMIKETLVAFGFFECMNYSFESPKVFDKLNIPKESSTRKTINITNPLGEDFSVMRTTTLNGMLQSLSVNYNRRNPKAALFEINKIYIGEEFPIKQLPSEQNVVTLGMYGNGVDFFGLKGYVEELLNILNIKKVDFKKEKELTFMHPGRCAGIFINNENVGFLGEIHPSVSENYEIGQKVYVAVINADFLYKTATLSRKYKPHPKYPAVERDISVLVNEEKAVKEIHLAIVEKGGDILEDVSLFDVYKGEQIEKGYKSVSYKLYFRASDRTLKEEEVSDILKKILKNIEKKTNAQLRDK